MPDVAMKSQFSAIELTWLGLLASLLHSILLYKDMFWLEYKENLPLQLTLDYILPLILSPSYGPIFKEVLFYGIPTGKEGKQETLPGPIGNAECIQNSSRKTIPIQFYM